MNEEEDNIKPVSNNKNSKIIIIIMGIVIVLLIALILVLLLTGSNNTNQEQHNNDKPLNNVENDNQNIENAEYSKKKVSDISFAGIACGGTDYKFVKDTVLVDNISTKNKLGMLAKALLKLIDLEKIEAGKDVELNIDIHEIAKKYFDVTPDMEKQMAEGFGTDFYIFTYKNNKSYINIIIGGCMPPLNEGEYTRFKGSKTSGNILVESYYYYYLKNESSDDEERFTYSYYKDKNDAKPIYSKVSSGDSLDYSKFDSYDLYFDTSDGNMKLSKIVYNAN